MADDIPRPLMQAQVVLDRLGFTPGVVDGKQGLSTRNAILGFQEANGLAMTGRLDPKTTEALARWSNIPATRVVTIPDDFAAGPFQPLPKDPADQAKLPVLGYASLDEKLAERFHTTIATLQMLNPQLGTPPAPSPSAAAASSPSAEPSSEASPAPSMFHAGQQIRVPNVGADQNVAGATTDTGWQQTLEMLGVGNRQPKADKIVVSKSKGTLKVFDSAGKLIGMYTATMGSTHDPLPLGNWKVTGISRNPKFHYNPALFWDVPDSDEKQLLPPGPNGPVGVVWIDLNKPHYGIHGTPSPETIGRAQSHGCVRLTNWDAARLAQMVSPGTVVLFET
jgi:lipoprotein-anchoring transpeptidase ErfK/SrfK